jgi:hypothetical protein
MFVTMSGLPNRLSVDPLSSRILFSFVLDAHCFLLLCRLSFLMIRLRSDCQRCVIVFPISVSWVVVLWFFLGESMICQYVEGYQDFF